MPLVLCRSPQPDEDRTMCKCVLHALLQQLQCHGVMCSMLRTLDNISCELKLLFHSHQPCSNRTWHGAPRMLGFSPNLASCISLLRSKACVQPTVPHIHNEASSRSTRHSQQRQAAAQLHLSEHPQQRCLSLSTDWLRHPNFDECDPEELVHYWKSSRV